ncbi:MAG: hypothetical protein MJ152_04785, partial [Clostridia bacterium]|nr:hypothetical protein [Clostridia bacterium]
LSKNYVLVGYLDASGHFVNSVRIKQGASKQTSLYVLQLKNKYGESTIQTIDGLTSHDLNDIYKNIYWTEDAAVKVTPKYELLDKEGLVNFTFAALKDDLISINEVNKTVSVYSGNSQSNYGYTITITTTVTGMIKNIMNVLANEPQPDVTKLVYFALFNANDVLIPGGSNLRITNYCYYAETETVTLAYYTEDVVAPGYYFRLCLEYNGVVVKSNKIYILSTDATDIRYNGTNQTISETNPFDALDVLPASTEEADAQSDDFCFEASIAVADDKLGYKYSYTAKGFGLTNVTEATFKTLFNAKCDRDTRLGFVATPLIATGHNIRYSTPAGNEDVFSFAYDDNGNVSGINITGIGSTYVIINSTVINRYVKVV